MSQRHLEQIVNIFHKPPSIVQLIEHKEIVHNPLQGNNEELNGTNPDASTEIMIFVNHINVLLPVLWCFAMFPSLVSLANDK